MVVLLLLVAQASTATVINGDGFPAPCGFSNSAPRGTNSLLPEWPSALRGTTVARSCVFAVTGHSPPNVLAFNADAFYGGGGIPRATETLLFFPAVDGIRFTAGSGFDPGSTLTAEAFDADDNRLRARSLVLGAPGADRPARARNRKVGNHGRRIGRHLRAR
ncbi:MAG: hypothetical protein AB7V27_01800 [Candidatus Binatia bacterium]